MTAGPSTIVIDEHNRPVGPGGIGRIARGGHIPLGYYKDPVKTAALFAEVDGVRYAVPGDFARVEEDGSITLLGRGNTCVNTGGEKVFPEEVEGALKSFAGVFDALVIGVPDERLGQRVAALVQPRDGHDIDLAELEAHLRTQIAGYKVPRSVWLVSAHRPDAGRQGRLPLGAPLCRGATRGRRRRRWHRGRPPPGQRGAAAGPQQAEETTCAPRSATSSASSTRSSGSPRPSTSPPRSAGPAGSACSAACASTTRPSSTRSWTGWTPTPTAVRTASTWSCPPRSRPRARPST